ncbi:hypothetical protein LWI28_018990 [Acer negundo]|uniref:SWIM-type domain-containing protein n=1 Tax=Acer negundo TaxID=4023 RepID=A0AAD5NIC5_ACENE|nr:hypothetical protein LWI28_018990 [Acer negundo]
MAQQLRTDTNVDASIYQYYRARTRAKELIQGSIKDQYYKLWEYCAEVRRMNPRSSVIMKCSSEGGAANPKFMRLYICLHALKKRWMEGCRRIIRLDDCFIKGYHTGQLLTAIGVDPNNQMYPVAYALVEFAQAMEKMKSESVTAYEWLVEKDPVHWSRAYFKDTEVIERLKLENSICHPEYIGNFYYQLRGPEDDQHIVDIEKKTCACNRWQLIGIPCIHGISALLSSNCNPIDYIHNKYKKENFIKAYAPVIYGINGPMMWPKTNDKPLECPLFKKQKGRPKKAKALQADEVRVEGKTKLRRNYVVVRCSICKQERHNKSTCERRGGGNLDGSKIRQGSTQVESLQASQGSNQAHGFQSSQGSSLTEVSPTATNSKKSKRMNST